MEYNLVEIWLRKDPVRWAAGALAGLFAGAVALLFAMIFASCVGMDFWFPAKLMGTILLGPSATEFAATQSIWVGVATFEAICLFFGFVFAHFTGTNSVSALLAMGLAWGAFSWVFLWNLFLQSFRTIFSAHVSSGAALPVCFVYGLALSSVAIFDPLLRRQK